MARIISQVNPETGRRQQIASVEGDFMERSQSLGRALGVSPRKAAGMSNIKAAQALTPGFSAFDKVGTNTLTPTPDFKLPPTATPVQAAGLQGQLETQTKGTDTFLQDLSTQRQEREKTFASSGNDLMTFLAGQEGKTARTAAEYSKAGGVDSLEAEVKDINQQMLAEQEALRKSVERIQTAPGTATAAERDREVRETERGSLRRQADLAIIQLSKQGRFDSAKAIADRAVAMQLEGQAQELEARKFIYQENKELFTKAEQRQFETELSDRNRKLEMEEFKLKADYEQKIKQSDPAYQLGLQLTKAQIANTYSEIAKKNAEAVAANNAANFVTPPMINPKTGKVDPTGNLASVISLTKGKDNVNLQNAAGVVSALQAFAERNPSGQFAGTGPFGGFNAFKSEEGKTNEADLKAIELKVQQWASGASLTAEQTKMVAALTPKDGDLPGQIRAKTNGLANFMLNQTRGTLAAQGINYQPAEVDFFDAKAPVNAFLDEAEKALNAPSTLYSGAGYNLD